MRRGRMMVVTVACAVATAVAAPGALGATPKQIYKDYADNGRLDQNYSSADLKRALKDAVVSGYKKPTSAAGLAQVGLLSSGSHSSLNRGYWVAYTGVLSQSEAATRAEQARAVGFSDAYPRYVSAQ